MKSIGLEENQIVSRTDTALHAKPSPFVCGALLFPGGWDGT